MLQQKRSFKWKSFFFRIKSYCFELLFFYIRNNGRVFLFMEHLKEKIAFHNFKHLQKHSESGMSCRLSSKEIKLIIYNCRNQKKKKKNWKAPCN